MKETQEIQNAWFGYLGWKTFFIVIELSVVFFLSCFSLLSQEAADDFLLNHFWDFYLGRIKITIIGGLFIFLFSLIINLYYRKAKLGARKRNVLAVELILIITISIILNSLMWGDRSGAEKRREMALAEEGFVKKYQGVFPKVDFVLSRDESAEYPMYKYRYNHGIYRIGFRSDKTEYDLESLGEDSLKKISDEIKITLLQKIPNKQFYDSLIVRFSTFVPVKPKILPNTSTLWSREFRYKLK